MIREKNTTSFFDISFLKKCEHLAFVAKKIRRGERSGEHYSFKKGFSLEFADYRTYQPGDDIRYIDWNLAARMDKLFVKLFSSQEELTIHILIDVSRSMGFGNPLKLDYAKHLAAALGYIGIANMEKVVCASFSDSIKQTLDPGRSKHHVFSFFKFILGLTEEQKTGIGASLLEYSRQARMPGLIIILSDFLDEKKFERGLLSLLYKRLDIVLLQILDETELNPDHLGELIMTDTETREHKKIDVDIDLLRLYRNNLAGYFHTIGKFCLKHGIEYMRTTTALPFEDLILRYLRQGSHLR
ncbi:MAG: DUF58 domain-containing protein [Spirochaetales bacterium]|nr:DUF58 domain-containing protein [Spirochaetales bacterium]